MQSSAEPRWIAASVAVVVSRASGRNVSPLRRLSKLPALGEVDAALSRAGRWLRVGASRRRRAGVVRDPKRKFPLTRFFTDVFRGGDEHAAILLGRNTRAVDPRPETGRSYRVGPGMDVSPLLGKHPAAFFLIEKDDRACGKA